MRSIELFTGAGGLALGIHQAGFRHVAVAEWDKHSVQTLRMNRRVLGLDDIDLTPTDVTKVDWTRHAGRVELLAGGVPCQPFSLGGRHRGHRDQRNLFPEMLRAVREIGPQAVLIENVKGLTRPSFRPYFDYVLHQLEMPEIPPRPGEDWLEHDARLVRERRDYERGGYLRYEPIPRLLECADYGVPQTRSRVLIVAFRNDLGAKWEKPEKTHSMKRLIYDQFVTGNYWQMHTQAPRKRPPDDVRGEMLLMRNLLLPPSEERWQTVRDALRGLPPPTRARREDHSESGHCEACHWGNPGARSYPGHDGSEMDWPAKTLKAGVHGVPGGENMLRNMNGTVRYFTAREAARIQTFPDTCHFPGTWGEVFRQLGNALPVAVARLIAGQIADALRKSQMQHHDEHLSLAASG